MNKLLENAKGVIFDVDGLLVDSEPLWRKTKDVYAAKHGKTFSPGVHEKVRGMGHKEVLTILKEDAGLEGEIPDLVNAFRETFYELAFQKDQLVLLPGASELIKALHAKGKILAIATGGYSKEKMEKVLKLFDLDSYFSLIATSDDVVNGKPNPDIFLFAADKMGIPKEECVILEDAASGVEAAKAAKIKVIAVQQEPQIIPVLEKLQPTVLVKSLSELL